MTPAERLTAAADLLEKRAGEAAAGPWQAHFVTEFDPDGAYDLAHVLAPDDDPEEGYSGIAVAPSILRPDATYIATMHPEVGKALAVVLREIASAAAALVAGFTGGWDNPLAERIVAGHIAGLPAWRETLALADLLLAGDS